MKKKTHEQSSGVPKHSFVTIVMSVGGSIIVPDEIDVNFLKSLKELVLDFVKKGNRVVIVCGGGKTCRKYQNAAKEIAKLNDVEIDLLGIAATRLNAYFVRTLFGNNAFGVIEKDPKKAVKTSKKIIISCGWDPGHSTDWDAVALGRYYKADAVLNLFDLDYVYDKNPKQYSNAKPIREISWKDFRKDIVGYKWVPGRNVPFDPIAAQVAEKHRIKVVIMNGKNLANLRNFLEDKEFKGTVVS